MKRHPFTLFLFGMVALAFGMLVAPLARAQVTDKPITATPAIYVIDIDVLSGKGCLTGWDRDVAKFGDWHTVKSAADAKLLGSLIPVQEGISAQDKPALTKLRTHNMATPEMLAANAECMAKMKAPPLRWVVYNATGDQVAYCLDRVTKKRTKECGRAPATIATDFGTVERMRADCRFRSNDVTATYCTWLNSVQTWDPAEPIRVTRVREIK